MTSFQMDSRRNPRGFRRKGVPDSALNVGSQAGRQPGNKNGGTSHLNRYRFLTADRRETTGNGDGSGA